MQAEEEMLSAAERHQKAVVDFDDAKDNELTAEHALTANMTEGAQGLMGAQGETVLENWNRATQRVSKVFIMMKRHYRSKYIII